MYEDYEDETLMQQEAETYARLAYEDELKRMADSVVSLLTQYSIGEINQGLSMIGAGYILMKEKDDRQ